MVENMGVTANVPVIIKRKKVISGGGHHGGAWKVAYADFVTAMMAFFMLMWLLNATTEQQRKGIADYFSPTIPINRVSGGGDGAFGGSDIFSQDMLAKSGNGGLMTEDPIIALESQSSDSSDVAYLKEIEQVLIGKGGESLLSDESLRHVVSEITDEGLKITVFAREGAPLFDQDGKPTAPLREIAVQFVAVTKDSANGIALEGHMAAPAIVRIDTSIWDDTADKADRFRALLVENGVDANRFMRITANGDREVMKMNPMAVENNRIVLVLLRA